MSKIRVKTQDSRSWFFAQLSINDENSIENSLNKTQLKVVCIKYLMHTCTPVTSTHFIVSKLVFGCDRDEEKKKKVVSGN